MHSLISLLALLPAAALAAPVDGPAPLQRRAPLVKATMGRALPSKYIVKFKDEASTSLNFTMSALPMVETEFVYDSPGFKGFAGTIDEATLESLRLADSVEYVEEDAEVNIAAYVSQTGAPWGLGRISSRTKGSTTYTYDNSAGAGTCSYIIDTGIYVAHTQFAGRAFWAANFVDTSNSDGNGHGTHVAGTVGGTTYGVAKATTLYAVKVLNSGGSGTLSGVIAGMDYVTNDNTRSCPNGKVANMSLSGSSSASLNAAARAMINAGVFLAAAASNNNANAANYSPAGEPLVCTVGASDSNDAKASFSNYGSVVDVFAPGVNVLSSWIGSSSATNTISGTSMASPHIAGLAAYLLTLRGPSSPTDLCAYIQSTASTGLITGLPSGSNTPNLLAFNGNPSG